MTDDQLEIVRSNPHVRYVEVDQIMRASCVPPVRVNSWGLTRVAEKARVALDGFFTYADSAGAGSTVYVVDTGIYVANNDFGGRATFGFKAETGWSSTDANGHGTHVASTCVGLAYGIARKATAVAVKVLGDDGSGTNAGVIAGVDWAASRGTPQSVINMSLGGGASSALDAAVNNAVARNVVVAVAAGNDNSNACLVSPARATAVLTVGSTQGGTSSSPDLRSSFSNYGTCVDLFAPGTSITAAWIGSTSAIRTISGTSMASPHVAGIAALLRGETPSVSAATIQTQLKNLCTPNTINLNCGGNTVCAQSPNRIAFAGCALSGQ